MVYLFYRLTIEPQHAEIIREELRSISSIYDSQALKNLNHLNGAINEIPRLHPSVPTGGYRESPPQGMYIAGRYVPGNTTIVAPRYTMGRRRFSQPSDSARFLLQLCMKKAPWLTYLLTISSRQILRPRFRFHPRATVFSSRNGR